MTEAQKLLASLNIANKKLHETYEGFFWLFKMGDHTKEGAMNKAQSERDNFRADAGNLIKIEALISNPDTDEADRKKLEIWRNFFKLYQIPSELMPLKDEVTKLESKIESALATQKEGYTDPKTGNFIETSKLKMRMLMRTSPNEAVRKACFDALSKLAVGVIDDYIEAVNLRNRFAKSLGFEDFYAYKLMINEGMTKKEVFDIFDDIYKKTRSTFNQIRELEKSSKPGLRKPWNFGFMMSGSFTKEEDPYYQFDEALMRWGRSFTASGIDFKGGKLQLDLLDRKGKYNNGFCHYPAIVNFESGQRTPGAANLTCNVVYGQVGSGFQGGNTLFHECAHAADRLNTEETENCLNTEWPPASVAWAETHSQFMDTMYSSIEWQTRYAKDSNGNPYPFELFERKTKQLRLLAPHGLHHIMFVSEFEKLIYETVDLTKEKVLETARLMSKKYLDFSEESLLVLSVPHIYDWESSAYYHAYGLAILALEQWRKYFYDKYEYIVDNPEVGREMTEVWKLASSKNFKEFVKLATGKELSPEAFLEQVTMSTENYLARARQRIERMKTVPEFNGSVNLNAHIRMLHGKEVIADNSVSFEDMAEKYKNWLATQKKHN